MTFSTQRLVDSRVLVRGTDQFGVDGVTTLDSTQWDEINEHKQYIEAESEFSTAVSEFFAPIEAAMAKLADRPSKTPDAATFVVLHEGTEGVEAVPGVVVQLNHDSIVLRLLDQGASDRLIWVNDTLEIVEAPTVTPVTPVGPTIGGSVE